MQGPLQSCIQHGDCSDEIPLEPGKFLPQSVMQQYDMSEEMWDERIRRWWINNHGQTREDAEMEYLRVAQDLEMYGIQYFPICVRRVSSPGHSRFVERERDGLAPRRVRAGHRHLQGLESHHAPSLLLLE